MTGQGTEALRHLLERQLTEIGLQYSVDQDRDLVVPYRNTITFVRPFEQGERTMVRIWAITNEGLELSDELTRFLVTENGKFAFGGFEAHPSGRVAFSHTLLGDFLQRSELEVAMAAVATTADRYGEEIRSRFGGKLFGQT